MTRRGLFSVLLLTVACTAFSQQKLANTLLWRISGKGLSQPSYLYGTMHLPDKRLFQFGDSVYHALESTQGMAIEIDLREAIDSMLQTTLQDAEEEAMLERKKVRLNRHSLNKTGDSLLRAYGITGDVANKKQLKKIRDRRMSAIMQ